LLEDDCVKYLRGTGADPFSGFRGISVPEPEPSLEEEEKHGYSKDANGLLEAEERQVLSGEPVNTVQTDMMSGVYGGSLKARSWFYQDFLPRS
jgi:hypothetical protein